METAHNQDGHNKSRRSFLQNITASGLGVMGLGAFLQSCAEKEVKLPPSELAQAYVTALISIIGTIRERELPKIVQGAQLAVQAKIQGRELFTHMEGAIFPHESGMNRPGSPHIFKTEGLRQASKNDIIVTNDPATANGMGEQFVRIIGITTPSSPSMTTPPGALENMGALQIEDVADIIINCHVPYTDGVLSVEGIEIPICPASSVIHSMIYYALIAEIVEGFTKSGIYPQIG